MKEVPPWQGTGLFLWEALYCCSHPAFILGMLNQDHQVIFLSGPSQSLSLSSPLTPTSCFPKLHWVPSPDPAFILVDLIVVEVKLPAGKKQTSHWANFQSFQVEELHLIPYD